MQISCWPLQYHMLDNFQLQLVRYLASLMALQVLRQEIIKSGEQNIQQPVNLKRLLWNAQRVFDKEQGGKAHSSMQIVAFKTVQHRSLELTCVHLPLTGQVVHLWLSGCCQKFETAMLTVMLPVLDAHLACNSST